MWIIHLQAAGLNNWLDAVEHKLTIAQDLLDVMEIESEQLREVWESSAGKIWRSEFQVKINEVRRQVTEMEKVILKIGEISRVLAEMEKNMILAADKL